MNQLNTLKKAIEELNQKDIQNLLNYLRQKTEFIIPRCYSKTEILKILELEGVAELLSESQFHQIKKEFDNSCSGIMTEILRTHLLMAMDASTDSSRI